MSFMFNPHPYDDPNPVNRPALSDRTVDSIITGEQLIAVSLAEEIKQRLEESDALTICMDGYATADWSCLVDLLTRQLTLQSIQVRILAVSEFYKSAEAIDSMLTDYLPEDREKDPVLLFGRLFKGGYETLFDDARLEKLLELCGQDKDRQEGSVTIVYGAGACHEPLRAVADMTVYLDVTPKQAVLRIRNGAYRNLGDQRARPFKAAMRRCYFYDFELACHLRAHLLRHDLIDYYVASDIPGRNQLLCRDAFNEICASLVNYPMRCKPVYLEGVWGGHYVKRLRGLPETMKNCAWVFDLIPLEVSLLIEAGSRQIEIPFFTFVCKQGAALMGEACVEAFGGYFPIRFNYDDSYHSSGNMSIQVHPTDAYIKEHFGEHGRQDESYYVVATGHNAKTYLGLREDVSAEEFIAEVRNSEQAHTPVDYRKYVAHIDSTPGTQVMIPAGTIHSSGRNQVVLEIGSLTVGSYTFKMYDYLRNDLDGKPRPIHTYHGEKVLDQERTSSWVSKNLVQQPQVVRSGPGWAEYIVGQHDLLYFSLHRYEFLEQIEGNTNGVFHVLTLVDGERVVVYAKDNPEHRYEQNFLDVVVVPANIGAYVIVNLGDQPVCVHKTQLKDDFKDCL